ncbi:MAG: MBL fold metallo-hydrolase [Nitrososphaerales archaeon]
MTSLTLYDGVDQIGGNKYLIQDRETKIFLDFGMAFGSRRRFYDPPFLSPRSSDGLLELGILPKLDGIYRFDSSEKDIDAILLSHVHLDHSGYVSFLKREIPVYCGETTARILKTLSEMRATSFEQDFAGIEFKTFRTGDKIKIDSMEIEPIHVDHSVAGAYGFIIQTSEGSLAYTGDFRIHGPKKSMTEDFKEKAAEEPPDLVLCEGTNLMGATVSSEAEVVSKLSNIVKNTSGLVLADFSQTDTDRLTSFLQAASKNGRRLALSTRQAYLLSRLRGDPHLGVPDIGGEDILIFRKSKKRYMKWEQSLLELPNVVDSSKIAGMQSEVVLVTSFYDFEELVEIDPVSGSVFILSASEPFNEEMQIDFERLKAWLDHYGVPQYHVHVSGHIMPLQLRQMLEYISPKKVYPIHTESPELCSRFLRGLKSEVIKPEKAKEYTL